MRRSPHVGYSYRHPEPDYASVFERLRERVPVEEIAVLASIYKLVIDSANRKAAGVVSTNGGDAKERSKDDSSATRTYTS